MEICERGGVPNVVDQIDSRRLSGLHPTHGVVLAASQIAVGMSRSIEAGSSQMIASTPCCLRHSQVPSRNE